MDELELILADKEKKTPPPASEPAPKEPTPEEKTKDDEVLKKEEQLINLGKAIAEANEELGRIRKEKSKTKVDDELPKIDFEDPSAKAWEKHLNDKVLPTQQELERAKQERRDYALRKFLADKPALAKNQDKIKELVGMYDRIKSSTELNSEGIELDLEKAYAATNHKELLASIRQQRIAQAEADSEFADIAVSKGATTYANDSPKTNVKLTPAQRAQLAKWGMTEAQWHDDQKKHGV